MIDTSKVQEQLDAAMSYAVLRGIQDRLQRRLDYLDQYANGPQGPYGPERSPRPTKCVLWPDFAPYSFSFVMLKPVDSPGLDDYPGYLPWFNGGLIYFGPGDPGSGAPQFSTRMPSDVEEDWEIHT